MKRSRTLAVLFLMVSAIAFRLSRAPVAQTSDVRTFDGAIGPFRGGRTKAITGVPGAQNVFYMAPVNGGVWKTTDFGRTWTPIFDDQPTGSIGSIAVAPSDANVIYAVAGLVSVALLVYLLVALLKPESLQ